MEWSKEVPTQNGLYWLRRPKMETTIVSLWDAAEGVEEYGAMIAWLGSDYDTSLRVVIEDKGCEWFGPLEIPE